MILTRIKERYTPLLYNRAKVKSQVDELMVSKDFRISVVEHKVRIPYTNRKDKYNDATITQPEHSCRVAVLVGVIPKKDRTTHEILPTIAYFNTSGNLHYYALLEDLTEFVERHSYGKKPPVVLAWKYI